VLDPWLSPDVDPPSVEVDPSPEVTLPDPPSPDPSLPDWPVPSPEEVCEEPADPPLPSLDPELCDDEPSLLAPPPSVPLPPSFVDGPVVSPEVPLPVTAKPR
jgi:hypothetical protein